MSGQSLTIKARSPSNYLIKYLFSGRGPSEDPRHVTFSVCYQKLFSLQTSAPQATIYSSTVQQCNWDKPNFLNLNFNIMLKVSSSLVPNLHCRVAISICLGEPVIKCQLPVFLLTRRLYNPRQI